MRVTASDFDMKEEVYALEINGGLGSWLSFCTGYHNSCMQGGFHEWIRGRKSDCDVLFELVEL